MTNEQLLKRVIEKATKGGWKIPKSVKGVVLFYAARKENKSTMNDWLINGCLSSHDFAVSFYGKDWRAELPKQILQKEQLKFMEKFLK